MDAASPLGMAITSSRRILRCQFGISRLPIVHMSLHDFVLSEGSTVLRNNIRRVRVQSGELTERFLERWASCADRPDDCFLDATLGIHSDSSVSAHRIPKEEFCV
jgi:hypothetical protein